MIIQCASDIHSESNKTETYSPHKYANIEIIAGDIHKTVEGANKWIINNTRKNSIKLCVKGNYEKIHELEFKKTSKKVINPTDNIIWLENQEINIGKINVFGCTLWGDANLSSEELINKKLIIDNKNDNKACYFRTGKTLPEAIKIQREYSLKLIEDWLYKKTRKTKIIVTHYPPIIPKNWEPTPEIGLYYNNLTSWLEKHKKLGAQLPTHWICGHSHFRFEEEVAGIKIIQNPVGKNNEKTNYNKKIIIV